MKFFLANRQLGLYKFTPYKRGSKILVHIPGEINNYLINDFVYCGNLTPQGDMILGTNSGGCFIIDKNGKIISRINKSSGLQHNNVHEIYFDKDKNLWLALNNGISRCDISVPITMWNESLGLEGIIESIIRFNGIIYIATHQGIYYFENNQLKKYRTILLRPGI